MSIYNFVQHEDAGYIVMEYVGGESLREVRNSHRERFGAPLPVAQAIAYILEILPAFAYLHRRGLLFCDFKPDNVIQSEDHLKLIDLGGVRSLDDDDSDLYGTVGYQAPEVAEHGASVSSDLYTVARTLAVLSFDFAGFQDERRYATSLPPVHEVPQFVRYESFHLFLLKATAEDPRARFQTAGEMADQLAGVLREVVAVDGGSPAPAPSTLFSGELGVEPESCTWQNLPLPVVDSLDAAAPLLATAVLAGPEQARALLQAAPDTPELVYHLARLAIDEGDLEEAVRLLDGVEAGRGGWRAAWWRGVLALARDLPDDAQPLFAAVAAELPGERAPKLALAVAHEQAAWAATSGEELGRHLADAARYYELVVGHRSLVRQRRVRARPGPLRTGRPRRRSRRPVAGAQCLERAHLGAARPLSSPMPRTSATSPEVSDLVAASEGIDRLRVEPSVRLPLVRQLQQQALVLLTDGRVGAGPRRAGWVAPSWWSRRSARRSSGAPEPGQVGPPPERERCELVDLANASRPRTLT